MHFIPMISKWATSQGMRDPFPYPDPATEAMYQLAYHRLTDDWQRITAKEEEYRYLDSLRCTGLVEQRIRPHRTEKRGGELVGIGSIVEWRKAQEARP